MINPTKSSVLSLVKSTTRTTKEKEVGATLPTRKTRGSLEGSKV